MPSTVRLLSCLVWSLLASEVDSRRIQHSPQCFVARHRFHGHDIKCVSRRRSFASPLGTRSHQNNAAVVLRAKPGRGGGDDRNLGARAMKFRMREAQLVEKLLLDAVDKMGRGARDEMPASKLFPSVRQCNAGENG